MSDRPSAERTPEQCVWDAVQTWLEYADEDLDCAHSALQQARPSLRGAAFHSQQAAEKFVKCFLVRHQVEFDRTHDIGKLLEDVRLVSDDLAGSLQLASQLTQFAVAGRYPGGTRPASTEAAEPPIGTAERVWTLVRQARADYLQSGRPE